MNKILKEIYSKRDKNRAKSSGWYFKTGEGQYGERDKFLGLRNAQMREIAKHSYTASFEELGKLLKDSYHEVRQTALFALVRKYEKASEKERKKIADFYLKNTKYINNWDLVDLSAYKILGYYLLNHKNKNVLLKLARSKNMWEQRIAIISTFAFIKKGEIKWSLKLAKMFLDHKHDLIHKASGWMLREVGKKDMKALRKFLDANLSKMPRTMLRYAIEKFPENIRKEYLKK
jgi:3-methyladenine DNA glycosylase AlkD